MSFSRSLRALLLLLVALVAVPSGWSQTYKVLYSFTGGADGASPTGGLILDAAGNLYGTAESSLSGTTSGSVFKVSPRGKFRLLHNFGAGGAGGAHPAAGLVQNSAGNLYGTTAVGGSAGQGTVFMLDKKGKFKVLYSFAGGKDGAEPNTPLILDPSGNLYGTTGVGGHPRCDGSSQRPCGTVFKLDPAGNEQVLFRFSHPEIFGSMPFGGVILDPAGNLFGVAIERGPAFLGTVFKLNATRHGFRDPTLFYAFNSQSGTAASGLIEDTAGNFYGTTRDDPGIVYKLDSQGNETTLYSFHGPDGADPAFSGVIMDSTGNLYGTTEGGGNVAPSCGYLGPAGCGVVYKLDPSGKETVLYQFAGGTDGANPFAGLVMDAAGNLYGTTTFGGTVNANCPVGCGVVFKITP